MTIKNSLERAFSDKRFSIFFSLVIAFVLAAAVTIDQQSKNLIKLLVVAGVFVTLFNWQQIKRHSLEFDKFSVSALSLFYLSILLSIALNPSNKNTLHDAQVMSIGCTSIFIWSLMISIRFRADYFWWGIVLCALSSGGYALVETSIHGVAHRAVGSSGKPIMFGDVAMISGLISIAATTHFQKYPSPMRFVPLIASVMGIVASLLSGSRGGWLFLPFAFAIVVFFLYSKGKMAISLRQSVISLALICSVAFLVFTYTNVSQRITIAYEEIHGYLTEDSDSVGRTSLGQRFEMWNAVTMAFNQAPFFGIGPGAFEEHLITLANANKVNRQVGKAFPHSERYTTHTHAHNEYLNTLATRGLFGLGTALFLFVYLLIEFTRLARSDKPLTSDFGLAGILLVSGYMVFSLSESMLYHAMTANFFFLTLVSLLYLSRKHPQVTSTST